MASKTQQQIDAQRANDEQALMDSVDAANAHAANPQMQLESLTVNPDVLPVSIPARARGLNTVVESQEPNITKEMIMRWGAFYITRAQVIVTNKPKPGDTAFLFSLHFPTHPGTWCEFFGTGDDRRNAIARAVAGRNPEPIGPVWLKHTITAAGNDYYFFSDTPPDEMRVNSVSVDTLPIVPEENLPF